MGIASKSLKIPKLALRAGITVTLGAGAAAASVAGVRAFKRQITKTCMPFYAASDACFTIPGLDSGFVPQDLFHIEDEDIWLFSGYQANRKPSPLYRLSPDGVTAKLTIKLPDGSLYKGHGAAIAATVEHGFLTVADGYVVMPTEGILRAVDGDVLQATAHVPVELMPAFMNIHDGVLYIGEFHHNLFYQTPRSHWLTTPTGKTNPALMYAYTADEKGLFGFAQQASAVFSIPGNIQGMCITANGKLVLSRSWGFRDAEVLVYDVNKLEAEGTYIVDGHEAPLFFLDDRSLERTITVPPMAEGVDAIKDHVYLSNESASNLYLLGKADDGKYVYSFTV